MSIKKKNTHRITVNVGDIEFNKTAILNVGEPSFYDSMPLSWGDIASVEIGDIMRGDIVVNDDYELLGGISLRGDELTRRINMYGEPEYYVMPRKQDYSKINKIVSDIFDKHIHKRRKKTVCKL